MYKSLLIAAAASFLSVAPAAVFTFSNTSVITIPGSGTSGPASPYPSTIAVSGVTGTVTDVNVTFHNLSHTFPDDLDFLLTGPLGQRLLLMSDVGGSLDLANVTYTFDDAAAASLLDGAFNASGTYKPTNVGSGDVLPAPAPAGPYTDPQLLSIFNGLNPNGTWSLYVQDDIVGDVGRMGGGWSIQISTEDAAAVPEPATISMMAGTAFALLAIRRARR